MPLANNTRFAADALPLFGPSGEAVVVVVAKATFAIVNGAALRAERQSPVRLGDVPHVPERAGFRSNGPFQPDGSPLEVSLRYPSDACTIKEGCDVIVVGDAVSPKRVRSVDVAVAVGNTRVALRVHGERVYDRHLGKLSFGPSEPFERRPLVWEFAYGGTSDDFITVVRDNPVGRGVPAGELDGRPAPCIEALASPLVAGEAGEPAGVGAVSTHWQPRAMHAGTFDEAWQRDRMPLAPLDASPRAHNAAPPWLVLPRAPTAGSPIATVGMVPEGTWGFELPALRLVARGKTRDGRVLSSVPVVDTIVVEPARALVELTARAVFPRGRRHTLLAEVLLDEP